MRKRYLSRMVISLFLGVFCLTMVGCGNKNGEDKEDAKIEQNIEDKEDIEDLNEKDENVDESKIENDGEGAFESEKSKEVRIYYVDEMTGEVTVKTIMAKTENDIWGALQETGILAEDCQLLSFKVNEEAHTIDLDFNAATGNRIRSMGTTGETQIIGCIVNTYLEAYDCDGIKLTEEGKTLQTSHGANYDGYSGIMSF